MKTDAAVWAVFSVLAEKMQQSKDVLSAQNVGNAQYGLRGISSDVPEEPALRAVLSELVPKMGQAKLASTERV
jgi:hypothetical protein